MAYIGIDVSLNSTCICRIEDNIVKYYNIHNIAKYAKSKESYVESYDRITQDGIFYLLLKHMDINFFHRDPTPKVEKIGLSEWERIHIFNSYKISKIVSDKISDILRNTDIVNIENYSHGAGNQLIQIVEFTSFIKKNILFDDNGDTTLDMSNLYITPGPTLKSWVHKSFNKKYSNDKISMVECWIELENEENDPIRKLVSENRNLFINKGKVLSPIDDIVDSYFLAKYGQELMASTNVGKK